ncbi:putative phage prohead protease [Dinoroseobacter shibae DFL 12 = DSM 16493]|jgi:HK97 family phage prohead protease|uniref:HK97 family phage prohead protease n=3 Tax=root TaxID=1 RepID=A0AA48P8H6_9VIRU|nr:HK97 family phage prohead protease [Dinoroseobacter shibae]ABV93911.1 putative phage prohead protease [Dinoroseobacter shibae DFL 12 = DSM 16493]URF45359.1 HK97 family phage prohead protease [Dinoroseobacter shibae]URF49664.1 HK97 family phage prohead protease [Dinoroseobacter shibae]DBA12236.1 TPA_asm: HK97 family phage prohead protease [Dinogtaviriform tomaschi]
MTQSMDGPVAHAGLETKFCRFGTSESDGATAQGLEIEGYASLFGAVDQGNDIVDPGAYAASLTALAAAGRQVKMLWQHDPAQPIGVWDEVREDAKGLYVKGRLLPEIARGREAAELIAAGALDGLSIGYRTKRASKDAQGRRHLTEVELWEVSLVTFPMLPEARVGHKTSCLEDDWRSLAEALRAARLALGDQVPAETTSKRSEE